jgi:hypothetical protein
MILTLICRRGIPRTCRRPVPPPSTRRSAVPSRVRPHRVGTLVNPASTRGSIVARFDRNPRSTTSPASARRPRRCEHPAFMRRGAHMATRTRYTRHAPCTRPARTALLPANSLADALREALPSGRRRLPDTVATTRRTSPPPDRPPTRGSGVSRGPRQADTDRPAVPPPPTSATRTSRWRSATESLATWGLRVGVAGNSSPPPFCSVRFCSHLRLIKCMHFESVCCRHSLPIVQIDTANKTT